MFVVSTNKGHKDDLHTRKKLLTGLMNKMDLLASPMQWTWVWVGSRHWWWTGKPGVLQSMGLETVEQDWVTELSYWKSPEVGQAAGRLGPGPCCVSLQFPSSFLCHLALFTCWLCPHPFSSWSQQGDLASRLHILTVHFSRAGEDACQATVSHHSMGTEE